MVRLGSLFLWMAFLPALTAGQEHQERPLTAYEVKRGLLGDLSAPAGVAWQTAGGENTGGKKSTGLAAIYSLLLPGMGELYANGFESGRYFLAAEGVLWLSFAGMDILGDQLRDDARAFARAHAGVSPVGKSEQYFVDIGNFIDIDEYNLKKLNDREPEKLYNPAAGYAWWWDSDQSRATYRGQRIASENMYNNRKFVVAAILVNHVGSAINAVRAAISHNRSLEEPQGGLSLHAEVLGGIAHPHGIMVTIRTSF